MTQAVQLSPVLILFAHPALEKSRVNRQMISSASKIPGIMVHDLYEAYPEFDIDVRYEQSLLKEHEIIIFHHPFFWYSTPAILKEWQDLVLEHGWAYGQEGTALRGKKMLSVVSTGGREEAYQPGGYNRYTIQELLRPISQTAHLCGMHYLPPFVVHGTHGMTRDEITGHAEDYRRLLISLSTGTFDFSAADRLNRINTDLESLIRK